MISIIRKTTLSMRYDTLVSHYTILSVYPDPFPDAKGQHVAKTLPLSSVYDIYDQIIQMAFRTTIFLTSNLA